MLQGCAGFWLAMLPVPTTVISSLVSLCRGFLWKHPRVSWANVCVPQEEGGLGLHDFTTWNRCFMMKYLWHIMDRRESLWVRWVHHRYLSVIEPIDWEAQKKDSPLIKAIINAKDMVVSLEGREDDVEETLHSWCVDGRFKVALAFEALRPRKEVVDWAKEEWGAHNTPKHMFILWLAALGRLSTYDRLFFLDVDPGCRFCGVDLETHQHLFFECPYSKDVWREVRKRFKIPSRVASIGNALSWLRREARGNGCCAHARMCALSATVYYIWHARNAKVFDGNVIPRDALAKLIVSHVLRLLHDRFPVAMVEAI